jgi:hypothetical protein
MIGWFFTFLFYLSNIRAAIMQQRIPNPKPPRPHEQQSLFSLPPERKFMTLDHNDDYSDIISFGTFRVLQFNMLADGLSGLRDDLGAFSRATYEDMIWEKRGKLLLHEILQYDPDVITLQECDHYYDCFLPELNARLGSGLAVSVAIIIRIATINIITITIITAYVTIIITITIIMTNITIISGYDGMYVRNRFSVKFKVRIRD